MQTNDIGVLFSAMQSAYGHLWAQKSDSIPIWQEALRGYEPQKVMRVAESLIKSSPDGPPSLGKFIAACESQKPRPTTYLPAPQVTPAKRAMNLTMLRVLMKAEGVDKATLRRMYRLSCALLEEAPKDLTKAWARDVERQLTELADLHDREEKARETELAREQFCIDRGLKWRIKK